MKSRLDLFLLEKGLASTRTKAQELIRGGQVLVNGKACDRPGERVDETDSVQLLAKEHPYVSRGGLKLEAALLGFGVSPQGLRVLDLGQSTGGFTHCLLLHGAAEVVGVEVGHGQLAPELRSDPRVLCLERQDIRALSPELLRPAFHLCVADLSFISLRLVVPCLPGFLAAGAEVVLLVKPQFEVGPENVGSGGLVRSVALREGARRMVEEVCSQSGFTVAGSMRSPIAGSDGNEEFLLHLRLLSSPAEN
jgi:23S rRNA (cytidine1920-2'-O)/16S rRNA (cytidine1409-2'-O)-methyltransferase